MQPPSFPGHIRMIFQGSKSSNANFKLQTTLASMLLLVISCQSEIACCHWLASWHAWIASIAKRGGNYCVYGIDILFRFFWCVLSWPCFLVFLYLNLASSGFFRILQFLVHQFFRSLLGSLADFGPTRSALQLRCNAVSETILGWSDEDAEVSADHTICWDKAEELFYHGLSWFIMFISLFVQNMASCRVDHGSAGPCWGMAMLAADQNPGTLCNCSSPWWYPSPSPIQKISGTTPWPGGPDGKWGLCQIEWQP